MTQEQRDNHAYRVAQLKAAVELPNKEAHAHARVSLENRHHCRECFCCACVDVIRARESGVLEAYLRAEGVYSEALTGREK